MIISKTTSIFIPRPEPLMLPHSTSQSATIQIFVVFYDNHLRPEASLREAIFCFSAFLRSAENPSGKPLQLTNESSGWAGASLELLLLLFQDKRRIALIAAEILLKLRGTQV